MASSYAALVSLIHVLNRVQHPACPANFDALQIQSLFEKVNFLVEFLEAYSRRTSEALAIRMVVAAFAAEDTIEGYITDQILERSSCDAYVVLLQNLEKAMQEMDLIIQEAMKLIEKSNDRDIQLTTSNADVVQSAERPIEMVKMIGFDNNLTLLISQLNARQSSTRIIPIVGMGGIGKTTLARNVFNHPRLNNIFDVKAWVTISQEHTVGKIIRPLLQDIGIANVADINDVELGDKLHKILYGRKYLLILDDIWDTKAWDAISRFFPDNNKGSRIILTTRILDVAHSITPCTPFDIQLLDDDKSWNLLSTTVFDIDGTCPLELEECGKKISKGCKGLPLTLAVIGGLLKTFEKTLEHWEDVAGNINSIICGEDGEYCLKILSLSYHHLPIHLKPCFLYFATYPYDYKISVSKLIKLWTADGFLKPKNNEGTTLEDTALKYLNDLVNRNLITIDRLTSLGEIKVLTVHDLMMDLCLREVEKERFLLVHHGDEEFPENERRVVFHGIGDGNKDYYDYNQDCEEHPDYGHGEFQENDRRAVFPGYERTSTQPKGYTRSFISLTEEDCPGDISRLNLLRIFSVTGTNETYNLLQMYNLRLLQNMVCEYGMGTVLSPNLSLLWNLETLIAQKGQPDLHPGIWNLRHVKHIIFAESFGSFPDPPPTLDAEFTFQNLQTLENVKNITDKVLDMIPNIRRLVLVYDLFGQFSHGTDKLAHYPKLEMLKLDSTCWNILNKIKFPNSLRKLHLHRNVIWRGCSFGSLPNLEVLKISNCWFDDEEWNTVEGEFLSLKVLSIYSDYLASWTIDDCCPFPSLERLSLRSMGYLEEIPEAFGESTTLELLKLDDCKLSICISAKNILDVQQSQGNDDLTVKITQDRRFIVNDKEEMREMKTCLESMANDKFHVTMWGIDEDGDDDEGNH